MRNITENGHSLAANYFGHLSADKQMNALSLFMLYPLHFMQNFLFHFTHSANLPSQLEQNVRHDEMTTMGTTRSNINGGKTTETQPTEKVEAVEQLENGRRADGHQNERGGRHNKNTHSQNGQERHGHDGSQGIHHDQHHIHVTTPKIKIHPPTVKLPPVPPEPNLARNCDQLAHLCHVPMYRKVMQRECQKTCGRDECQDDREDLCIQWERRNFCTLRFYATMRWKCARTCQLCIPIITHK